MDARLHQLQGEAERVNELLALVQEFYLDKQTAFLRHREGARFVSQYDANNTYQYIVNREETQLSWLATAIRDLDGEVPADPGDATRDASGKRADVARRVMEEDLRDAQAFVDRWRPRVDAIANARQRSLLGVILGETLEQRRFFEQARAGHADLLGRRGEEVGARVGTVLPDRWIE
jgi:hypothetical protein